MSSFLQGLQSRAKDIRETLTPALSTSAFTSRGVLTPQQFVLAGDELVASCPTWQWSGASGKGARRGYLPEGKQFLVTRGVPSSSRCRGEDFLPQASMMKDNGEGWMVGVTGQGSGAQPPEIFLSLSVQTTRRSNLALAGRRFNRIFTDSYNKFSCLTLKLTREFE